MKLFKIIVIFGFLAVFFFFGILANEIYRDNVYGDQTIPLAKISPVILTPTPKIYILDANKLQELINNWRVQNGYKAFTQNEYLCDMAKIRMESVKQKFSHDGFQETTNRYMFGKGGFKIDENLAEDTGDEEATLKAWLDSPEHKKNLIADLMYSCIYTEGDIAVHLMGTFNFSK